MPFSGRVNCDAVFLRFRCRCGVFIGNIFSVVDGDKILWAARLHRQASCVKLNWWCVCELECEVNSKRTPFSFNTTCAKRPPALQEHFLTALRDGTKCRFTACQKKQVANHQSKKCNTDKHSAMPRSWQTFSWLSVPFESAWPFLLAWTGRRRWIWTTGKGKGKLLNVKNSNGQDCPRTRSQRC